MLCLIPGGFKPYHIGHHIKYLYGEKVFGRSMLITKRGTRENFTEFTSAVQDALLKKYQVNVEYCSASPIKHVFEMITNNCARGEEIVVLGGADVINIYLDIIGTSNEEKYFGTLHKDGKLHFLAPTAEHILKALPAFNLSQIDVHGTEIRKAAACNDVTFVKKYMPSLYTESEIDLIIKTMR